MGLNRQKISSRSTAIDLKTDFLPDISLLLQQAPTREQLIIRLLWETGITPQELVSLQKTDLTTHTRTLLIRPEHTKNKLARTLLLSTQLARKLATHAQQTKGDYLFSTRQSPQLSTRRVEQVLATACKNAGIRHISPRDLRRAYCERAAKTAKNTEELQELTGLKSITHEQVLTEKEHTRLDKVLKKTPARNQALISVILQTGKPLQETLTLTRQDISTLAITPQLATLLRTLARTPDETLFKSRQSTQLTTRRAEQLISKIGAQAKLELTSTLLRTTALRGGRP